MNLRAWFDPDTAVDPRQFLISRQVLGSWALGRIEGVEGKKLFLHNEQLRLADGSSFSVSATCDWTFVEPQITLGVFCEAVAISMAMATGTAGLSLSIATGKGGMLALQVFFDRDEQSRPRA